MSISDQLYRTLSEDARALLGKVPGPTPLFPAGNLDALLLGGDTWMVLARWIEQYGDVVLFWLGTEPCLLVNDPEVLTQLFASVGPTPTYKKLPVAALDEITTDTSPFICNGQDWHERRAGHPLSHADFGAWLATQVPKVRALTQSRAQAWVASGERIDMRVELERLVFDLLAQISTGRDPGDEVYRDFRRLSDEAHLRITAVADLPDLDLLFGRLHRRWFAAFEPAIDAAIAGGTSDSLVDHFWSKTALDREAFRNELANIHSAGNYSLPSVIQSTLSYLAAAPAVEAELVAALRALAGAQSSPDHASLHDCAPLRWAIKEALRLRPGAPFFTRNTQVEGKTRIAGVELSADTYIWVTPWLLHRRQAYWGEDAEVFRPSRWATLEATTPFASPHFWPFGLGPRECLGKAMALFVSEVVVATLLVDVQLEVDECERDDKSYFGSLVQDGVYAQVRARG